MLNNNGSGKYNMDPCYELISYWFNVICHLFMSIGNDKFRKLKCNAIILKWLHCRYISLLTDVNIFLSKYYCSLLHLTRTSWFNLFTLNMNFKTSFIHTYFIYIYIYIYISKFRYTPMITSQLKFETVVWRLMKDLARS